MKMGLIEDELREVKELCEGQFPETKVVCCVRQMVRIEIEHTTHKKIIACLQFSSHYPTSHLLIELKSTTLGDKLLNGLVKLCEQECKKYLQKPQILRVVKFLRNFLRENPLCICNDEISLLKKEMISEKCELKLKQKQSSVLFKFMEGEYYFSGKVFVPNNYPAEKIDIENGSTNFPNLFFKWIVGQANEIARQCVTPPLKKNSRAAPFVHKPSFYPVLKFIAEQVKHIPGQSCAFCKTLAFPSNAQEVVLDPSNEKFIERVLCGHIFHYGCIDRYMKTPPFRDGKPCPNCKQLIYHHQRWRISATVAEQRWAHKEAKRRELEEVEDFFK